MPVYIDRVNIRYGRMIMCHMIADSLEELHEMADRIGIQRKWLQDSTNTSFPHCDISLTKKKLALQAGAIECDRNTCVGHMRRLRAEWGLNEKNEELI